MRKTILSISAYFVSLFMGLSFFIVLFKILQFNYFIGFAIISLMVLLTTLLITDPDLIQEAED